MKITFLYPSVNMTDGHNRFVILNRYRSCDPDRSFDCKEKNILHWIFSCAGRILQYYRFYRFCYKFIF